MPVATAAHRVFGVRHHGPGSARALREAFVSWAPDCLLVEGPPDADTLLPWLGHAEMEPPVALLVYRPDQPERASYFPFARFSPEWQGIRYALDADIPVHFMDLPQRHGLAVKGTPAMPDAAVFKQLARAAGFHDYEAWWNVAIEQRQASEASFTAVMGLMQTLRAAATRPSPDDAPAALAQRLADQREAHMRQTIRRALAAGHARVAVVCGAWHGPALLALDGAEEDAALLADLPTVDVDVAWVPWTYGRLARFHGYGAGVQSPGWYDHLWAMGEAGASPEMMSIHWLSRVGRLLREEGLDASSAHIIDAVRLAAGLAALREQPFPGLVELEEAIQSVFCGGDAAPLDLIRRRLVVGERMGRVPDDIPMAPLQRDLHAQQRRLRLRPEPEPSTLKLDLRDERHLARSHFLHRLNLLDVPWGQVTPVRGKVGTAQELWRLQWRPELSIRVVEATVWGNSVAGAAERRVRDRAEKAMTLPDLTALLDQVILADLGAAMPTLLTRIETTAALTSDVPHMMGALPPLARILRYGDVRGTDQTMIRDVVDGLLRRICVGLPSTCASLNDEAAAEMLGHLTAVDDVVGTLRATDQVALWHETLGRLADQPGVHGLLAGRACRLLLDAGVYSRAEAARRMERALSPTTLAARSVEQLAQMAAWLDGFLKGSGLLVLHDESLWGLLDAWVNRLDVERFQAVLPLLRRTFASFSRATREALTHRVQQRDARPPAPVTATFDPELAARALPTVATLLGLAPPEEPSS